MIVKPQFGENWDSSQSRGRKSSKPKPGFFWQQQLERSRYEVTLARTRYEQVDPTLRLVAAELERLWEAKLQALAQVEAQWQAAQAEQLAPLSPDEEAQIRQLARNLPALWAAESTTLAERKRLLRTLIATVTLDRTQAEGMTTIHIRWQSGATTTLIAQRPTPGHPANPSLLARIRTLAPTHSDEQIAALLNAEGLVSSWHVKADPTYRPGQPVSYWTPTRVRNRRHKQGIPPACPNAAQTAPPEPTASSPPAPLRTNSTVLSAPFSPGFATASCPVIKNGPTHRSGFSSTMPTARATAPNSHNPHPA